MDLENIDRKLRWIPASVLEWGFRQASKVPAVRRRMEDEYRRMLASMGAALHPYRATVPVHARIPAQGISHEEVLQQLHSMQDREARRWKDGQVSGAVYHGGEEHIQFLNRVYALHSQTNPLHADIWPSLVKFEAEIVAMTAGMLGAPSQSTDENDEVCGTVTSGGTESILLAMKAYRDRGRDQLGIDRPEIIAPSTAHAAFDKAADYFGMKITRVPVGDDYCADVSAMRRAVSLDTVVMVGSAPSFPHGTIDPIEALSEVARRKGIGFHTDACLGGFVLPWAERLGYPIPRFDFRLPGVSSMSADTHKYGFAAKGTSVVLYRGRDLRRYQYHAVTDWPGGLYASPTLAGSRPGGLSAACWAAMVATGEDGYMAATKAILETAVVIRRGIEAIDGLEVLGDPLWVIAFGSSRVNIYRVMEFLAADGWNLNGLHRPPCVHLCVTLRHTQPGVAQRFLDDLAAAVRRAQTDPPAQEGMAPIYGMVGTMPVRGAVREVLKRYLDALYETGAS